MAELKTPSKKQQGAHSSTTSSLEDDQDSLFPYLDERDDNGDTRFPPVNDSVPGIGICAPGGSLFDQTLDLETQAQTAVDNSPDIEKMDISTTGVKKPWYESDRSAVRSSPMDISTTGIKRPRGESVPMDIATSSKKKSPYSMFNAYNLPPACCLWN